MPLLRMFREKLVEVPGYTWLPASSAEELPSGIILSVQGQRRAAMLSTEKGDNVANALRAGEHNGTSQVQQ